MEYRFLGRSGLKVSALALGAMTFGRETDEPTSYAMLDRFVAAGGTFIDTSDAYAGPDFTISSEEILGRWLPTQQRDDLVLATKVRWATGAGPNDVGLSRKHIISALERSLRRLGTDYVDLYQIHGWDGATPLEETLSTLDTLVRSGKVRYVGASNVAGWQLQRAIDVSLRAGWEPFVSLQPLYNLLDRETEWELLPAARANGLGVLPWSPLRGGWLSGKFDRHQRGPEEGTRIHTASQKGWRETWDAYGTERTWHILDTVREVAAEAGRTPAQVALNWLLAQPGVTAPIIGARTLEHFEDNMGAVGWTLDDKQVDRLTNASERWLPHPYDVVTNDPERV